jgi:hypothetical protein
MIQATCPGCGKVWQVPHADRIYKCRACGGDVRAEAVVEETQPPPPPETVVCAICKSENPAGQRYCTECGALLSEAPVEPLPPVEGDRVDARILSKELKSARETIG